MRAFYEGTMLCWILSCILLKVWESKIVEITTYFLFILYNISIVLLLYETWHEVKSFKQVLLKNRIEVTIAILPILLYVIVHL